MEEHPAFADGGSGTVRVAAPPKPRRHGSGQPPRLVPRRSRCAGLRFVRNREAPRAAEGREERTKLRDSPFPSLTLLRHFLQSSEDPGGVPRPEARYADQRTESRI